MRSEESVPRPVRLTPYALLLTVFQSQFGEHFLDKVLGAPRRGDHAVGHCLAQFIIGGPCLPRDREVLVESVRAADRHGAADPDQFASLDVEHFRVGVVEEFAAGLHGRLPP